MIKAIADRFYLGTIKTFSKLKVSFIHASDMLHKTIYVWSLIYTEEGSAYEMWLEGAQDVVLELEREHKSKLRECGFSAVQPENLSTIVNPSIMKLIEEEEKTGMRRLGSLYT
ncbi:hypothetical protein CU097_010435 [Rhizopus azygosporus]|uniref:Uncharacterized protein n=1 Tax=Rhizopus azygosporus TaxID=86630 RepID=A0A367JFS2_RHIAZ|nr:hypothetical protein CU097_010435 [Rhizopus azygosporus]